MKEQLLKALKKEIINRQAYLNNETIDTIYFGGGTPSILTLKELNEIFESIYKNYNVVANPEITLEANPDDLDKDKIKQLSKSPINRLSIGVQSFHQKNLNWMNRAHTIQEAISAITVSQDYGFDNITIDLIYGLPDLTNDEWEENIYKALDLNVPHLSCYSLTQEEKTVYDYQVKKNVISPPAETKVVKQFEILTRLMNENEFEHYEISNFCKTGFHSKHNSSYWQQKKYIGFGPSAHSFDQLTRQWNIANNAKYIKALKEGHQFYTIETIDNETAYNEYILTSIRTIWGIDIEHIKQNYGADLFKYFNSLLSKYRHTENLVIEQGTVSLSDKGKLLADKIAVDFFYV